MKHMGLEDAQGHESEYEHGQSRIANRIKEQSFLGQEEKKTVEQIVKRRNVYNKQAEDVKREREEREQRQQ